MRAHGAEIRINRFLTTVDDAMGRVIEAQFQRTLGLLPRAHFNSLQYIDIRQARDREGNERMSERDDGTTRSYAGGAYIQLRSRGCDGDGCDPNSPNYMIAIDIDAFNAAFAPWNGGGDGINYTLLHETGHIVDKRFGGIDWLRENHRTGLAAMLAHPHNGIKQGDGEHFADAYADYYNSDSHSAGDLRMEGITAFLEGNSLPLQPSATPSSAPAPAAGGMPLPGGV